MWSPLRYHPEQARLWTSQARFKVVPAGRRSGKTEIAKRRIITDALSYNKNRDGWFVCAAPTHSQAKRIYWRDLKKMVPKQFITKIREGELQVDLWNGARLQVLGMDQPARVEGAPLDAIILDEYGNMKEGVFDEHVGPALDTIGREGYAWFIGVPEWQGVNDYEELFYNAQSEDWPDWDGFTWKSADILDPDVVARAKARMDLKTFQQEYEAAFIHIGGRCYYTFTEVNIRPCTYDPKLPLIFCFDFNVDPGTATVMQKQKDGKMGAIGEVWLNNSNTVKVCNELIRMYPEHKQLIYCYGDATGGARGTAQTEGSDWDLIKKTLRSHYGSRVQFRVPKSNPPEKTRVNAMNSRICSADGEIHFVVDPRCIHLIEDFRKVPLASDGSIDKKKNKKLTHASDGVGYWATREHPLTRKSITVEVGF